jgi:lysyl-tRNA synthetase class 2
LFPQMRPEKKQVKIELEEDEKLIVALLQTNDNKMEFGLLKIKSELSGKKWDKAMKNLSSLGLTEVVVDGDSKACQLKE